MKKAGKTTKIIIYVFSVILLMCLIIGISNARNKQTDKIPYTQFLECVEKDKVEKVIVNSSTGAVSYKLKDSDDFFSTYYPFTDDFIEKLLLKNIDVEIDTYTSSLSIFNSLLSPLFTFGMLAAFFLLINGGKQKEEVLVKSSTKFSDVAGMEEVKDDLLLISKMMKDEKLKESGARIPRGILLEGPPGNGKTLLARAFAGETGVNFIAFNACDANSPLVGIGSMKIKSIFDKAKKNAPCVIFIDELDAVGSARSDRDDSASKEMNSILTSLLNQMDGFTPNDDVMIIAATNRANTLDPALVRPGRFDRKFVVGLPDKTAREELFNLYINKSKCNFDVDVSKLATRTYGCSSSEIECIVNEAVINSIKHKKEDAELTVNLDDFNEAILSMGMKGRIKKNYKRDDKDNVVIAYHESGHAIATYFKTNKKVSSITIAPTTSGAGGFTVSEYDDDQCLSPLSELRNEIISLYAGRAAEYVFGGKKISNVSGGASNDIQRATQLSVNYVELLNGVDHSVFGKHGTKKIMDESETILKECWEESIQIIDDNWQYVQAVAEALINKEKLENEEFETIIKNIEESNEKK